MDNNNEYNSDNISCTSPYVDPYTDPYADSYADPYADSYADPYTDPYEILSSDNEFSDNNSDDIDAQDMTNRERLPSNEKIILEVRRVIYNSLERYWNNPEHIGLIAT
ncbi:22905_t:CDS:2, partial [Gigaspora margarita]